MQRSDEVTTEKDARDDSKGEGSHNKSERGTAGARVRRRVWQVWIGISVGVATSLGLAWLPPFVPASLRPALMRTFAPLCHQQPGRSPHVDGVVMAVCDRCSGIYAGLIAGAILSGFVRSRWRRLGDRARFVLLGSLVPLGIDWAAYYVGAWTTLPVTNTPLSRAVTGFVFGLVAALYVVDSLTRAVEREMSR